MVQVIKEIATLQQFDSSSYALGLGVSNESPHFIKPSMTVGELGPKTLSVLRRRKSTVAAQEKPKISVEVRQQLSHYVYDCAISRPLVQCFQLK